MPIRNETSTRFSDEIRIIPPTAYVIAVLAFITMLALVAVLTLIDSNAPPLAFLVPVAIVGGTATAGYILLVGYVNRDAGRRGMSRLAWTLIAIFVPNALGVVLYFILRKPRASNCPQCDAVVDPSYRFCPQCQHSLAPVCAHCRRSVNAGDRFCPYCGGDLTATAVQPGATQAL